MRISLLTCSQSDMKLQSVGADFLGALVANIPKNSSVGALRPEEFVLANESFQQILLKLPRNAEYCDLFTQKPSASGTLCPLTSSCGRRRFPNPLPRASPILR